MGLHVHTYGIPDIQAPQMCTSFEDLLLGDRKKEHTERTNVVNVRPHYHELEADTQLELGCTWDVM